METVFGARRIIAARVEKEGGNNDMAARLSAVCLFGGNRMCSENRRVQLVVLIRTDSLYGTILPLILYI